VRVLVLEEVGSARVHDVVSFAAEPGHRWVLLRGP